MSWKKTLPFFVWQSFRYAKSVAHFKQIWSYHRRWAASFEPGRNSMSDELPWLTFSAIDFLQNQASPKSKIFEFGGGGSTLFFCKNVAQVATVEHDKDWFEALTETITNKGYTNWQGFFVTPEEVIPNGSARHPNNPDDFLSGAPSLVNLSFEKYAKSINSFPDNYFDIILVDGRARPSCFKQAIPHLKIDGLMVIDNTERSYYLSGFQDLMAQSFRVELHDFGPGSYVADFTRTTILRKIK